NAGNSSNTAAISVIVGNTAPTAGTLSFANLDDTGHTDTTPITKDGTFDLSSREDTDANDAHTDVAQQHLHDAASTHLPCSTLSLLAHDSFPTRRTSDLNAGNSSNTAAISLIVGNTAPTAGTLSFANLDDTGHTDTTPITKDGTFDL